MNKSIGYIVTLIGALGFALTYPSIQKALSLNIDSLISSTTLTLISVAIIVIGVFMLIKSRSGKKAKQKEKEVPIYKGKDIIGYRRN